MESLLADLEGSALAQSLRFSRWGYAGISAAHIFGIALLVGAILPLNLRFLGAWPTTDRPSLVAVLVPVAMVGTLIAVATGALLFCVRATEYADLSVLWAKWAFVAMGISSAIVLHARHGLCLRSADEGTLKRHACISLACWVPALICGRLIAFVG